MEKILVIDDDAEVRENLKEILTLADFEVFCSVDGDSGIRLAREVEPDLILCDITMPHMDGYEVLDCLQSIPEISTIPLIFLTGNSEPQQQRQGMELGADDYITKPFDISTLLASIQIRLLKQKRVKQQLQKERDITKQFQKLVQESRRTTLDKENMLKVKDRLLDKIVESLGDSVNNINLAGKMLGQGSGLNTQEKKYLAILKEETQRQIKLIDEVVELQSLLKPENVEILQRYNLLS
jgi:DNA-binding response OmpR family regulator